MRIAYCIHALNLSGGIERVLTLKANYLADRLGYDVWIITARMKGRKTCFPLNSRIHTVDLGVNDRLPFQRGRLRRALDRQLKEIRPDITVSMGGAELFILPRCTDGSVKIGEFHFSHDKFLLKYGRNAYAHLRIRRIEKAAACLDAFVVLTRKDLAAWQTKVPHVRQIYNPLTFEPARPAPLTEHRVMAAGRLEPQKNFSDLIRAWAPVAAHHPGWTLDIFGEGSERPRLERLIHHLGLEQSVLLKGRTSHMKEELLAHAFLTMSSTFEGFPMILLEAAACGLPLVSYDCPCGPSEIVEDGVNGCLVPAGDTGALAEGMERMISSDRTRAGQASLRIAQQFSLDAIMEQWDRLFRELIQNAKGRGTASQSRKA